MMNDKSKKQSDESKLEIDKTFLEKSHVRETMGDLVTQLTANRPADPLQFMADYFQSNFEQSNRLEKSYQIIMLTHHTRPAFKQNLATAFDILNQTKLTKQLTGINGLVFDELLSLLLKNTPTDTVAKVKHKLCRRQYEAVTYEVFYYAVSTVIIYKDYLEVSEKLFELMDMRSTSQVDRAYSELLINQLLSTFTQLNTDSSERELQACFSLSPEGLYSVLSKVPRAVAGGKPTLNQEQFLELSATTFLTVIQSVDSSCSS